MSVTQIHEALGTFDLEIGGDVPRDILDGIQYFGHIAIIPGRLDPRQYGDGCLDSARYVGVVRKKKIADKNQGDQSQASTLLSGVGLEFWLGDEDGKGEVIEAETSFNLQSFSTVINTLRPDALDNGTIHAVTGTYSGRHQYETPRAAIKYVCETMSTEEIPVGYRVNNNFTLDAGPESNLFVTTPKCVIVRKGAPQGEDMSLRALSSTLDLEQDMEDFSTRVVMLAESNGESLATGSADIGTVSPGTNIYKDPNGNALQLTRLVSESDTIEDNADIRAELALRKVIEANRNLTISADDYEIHGSFVVGDYVWVYDPDAGIVDTDNEITIRGTRLNPMKLRVTETQWQITDSYTVAYRDADGNWTDLTDYIEFEAHQAARVLVGDYTRALTELGEPVNVRLGSLTPSDTVAPNAPTWVTPFSGGVYLDSQQFAKARTTLTWNTPVNNNASAGGQFAFDNFNRTNSSTGMGTSTSGHAWTNNAGTLGISSNQSYAPTATQLNIATIDAVNADVTVSAKVAALASGQVLGLVFRYSTTSNYWRWRRTTGNQFQLEKVVSGTPTAVGGLMADITAGDTLKVVMNNHNIELYVNNTFISAHEDSFNATATRCGLMTDNPSGSTRFDDFSVSSEPTGGTTVNDGDHYELGMRIVGQTNWKTYFVGWGTNSLLASDLSTGVAYEARIRAADTGGNISPWSIIANFTTTADTIAPSTPAAPSVATSLTAVQITHTLGKASGGTYNLESDLAYLEVYGSVSSGFTPSSANLLGTVRANQGMMTATTPLVATFTTSEVVPVYIKVIAVDMSGNKSAASAQASATATLIDNAHISDLSVSKITAGNITTNWLLAASIRTAASGARVELNSSGFQAFDSAGTNTVNITNSGTFSLESPPSSASTPAIEWVGASEVWAESTATSTVQINRPANVQVGDLMLAFIQTNATATASSTAITGWTNVTTVYANATTDTNLVILKRDYAVDDPAYWTGTTVTTGLSRKQSVVVAYRGADLATNQFIATNSNTSTAGAETLGTNSATNNDAGAWTIAAWAAHDDNSAGTWTSTEAVERVDAENGSSSPWQTLTVHDSGAPVSVASQSRTGTFDPGTSTNWLSASAWIGIIKPLPQASSQSRIEMDHTGIRAYNQVNSKTLEISAGTGAIDLQGSVSSFNYLEGHQGWRIDGAGSSQFENINVLGTVGADAGTFESLDINGIPVATYDWYEIKTPSVRSARESSLALTNSSTGETLISWTTKYHERNTATDSMHSTSTNASRIKAPVDGIYTVSWKVGSRWTAGAPTNSGHTVNVRKNSGGSATGGTKVDTDSAYVGGGNFGTCSGTFDIALAAGDYLEWFSGVNASGTTRELNVGLGESHVSMTFVSSLTGIGTGGTDLQIATFDCIACRTFQGNNTERPPNIGDWAYQGYYSSTYGNQKSMLRFDHTAIAAALSGKSIAACKLKFHVQHSYYSTMDVSIGTHNNTTETAWPGAGGVTTNRVSKINAAAGATYTVSLGIAIGDEFKAGTTKGIVFGPGPTTVPNYYGYIVGYQPSSIWNPQLEFQYS